MPQYETDNRVLDVLEIPGKGRCHVYIARSGWAAVSCGWGRGGGGCSVAMFIYFLFCVCFFSVQSFRLGSDIQWGFVGLLLLFGRMVGEVCLHFLVVILF